MYSRKILNFQESTTTLNACTKKSGNLLNAPCLYVYIYIYRCQCVCVCVCAWIYIYIYIYRSKILSITQKVEDNWRFCGSNTLSLLIELFKFIFFYKWQCIVTTKMFSDTFVSGWGLRIFWTTLVYIYIYIYMKIGNFMLTIKQNVFS